MAIRKNQRKLRVLERDGNICWLCNREIAYGYETLDHVVPSSKGGTNNLDNLKLAHMLCNSTRGTYVPGTPEWEKFQKALLRSKVKFVHRAMKSAGISLNELSEAEMM